MLVPLQRPPPIGIPACARRRGTIAYEIKRRHTLSHSALGAGTSTSPSWPQSVKWSPSVRCCMPEQV
jgi:hypothetical protein